MRIITKNLSFILVLLILCFLQVGAAVQLKEMDHPRLLLLKGEENVIKKTMAANPTWAKMHDAIIAESNKIIDLAPVERIQVGRRLLEKSREALRRIFFLSYAYRMTGEDKFFQRCEKELLAVSNFSDWNPSHFLDVAEMTMGVAIGYDWLYDKLSPESRAKIKEAILKMGIEPSFDSKYNGWLKASNNWNQVCNAGMTFGAIAIAEDQPELAKNIIERAFESLPISMKEYQPHGAYPEGYGYWGYGTSFNVMFLSAVERYLNHDKGLSNTPGFLESAGFLQFMTGATGLCYNWGDSGLGGSLSPAMFWFAQKTNNPSLLWVEKSYLQDDMSRFARNRLLPAIMIWGKDIPLDKIKEPATKVWMGQGANPVCLIRTSWTDPNSIYVGFKAGSPSVNHAHMDVGSFIMESDGIRWASDFGMQDYESLESKGVQLWGRTQESQRWTVFRLSNYAHSTLTVDNQIQKVEGYAKIDKYGSAENFSFAVSDISSLYKDLLASAKRGVAVVDKKFVVVQDELASTSKATTTVRWNMLTSAEVAITGSNTATLTKNGKKLMLKVEAPAKVTMKTWGTEPKASYDAANPGTIMVGFEFDLPANKKEKVQVLLIPESAGNVTFKKELDKW